MKTFKHAMLAAFTILAPHAWAQTISNPSFESNTFTISPGYVIDNGPITGWTAPGNAGLNPAGGDSSFADNGATPQGVNVAFMQGVSSLSNSVTGLTVGLNYQVTVRANSSLAGGGSSNPGWSLNGGVEMPFIPPPIPVGGLNPYYTYSASFLATSTTAPLIIRTHGGGGSLLLDDFTVAIAPLPPMVATLPASRMTNTVATLNATVNPNATNTLAWFEWGTANLNYQQQTAPVAVGSGLVPLAVSNNVTGLTPGNFYHARVVGSNALGVVRGKDIIFGSPAIALNGANPYTNECHFAFTDLASASGSPLAVAAGALHSLALKSDGRVVAWGDNEYGETNVPAGLSNVVAIASGGYHSLALKSDGTVVAWGYNHWGQTNVPPGLSNVVAVAGGGYHSLALKNDGTVVAWGYNEYGQTNVPAGLSSVVAVAGGFFHSLALKSDGTVVAWGINDDGQTNVPSGLSNAVAVAGGFHFSLALKRDGTVAAWGQNGNWAAPPGLSNVVAVAGGSFHGLALKSDRTVVAWEAIDHGQTNVPPGLSNVVAIAGGGYHSLALKSDGTVVAWENNDHGQTNVPVGLNSIPFTANGSVDTNSPGSYLLTYTASNIIGGIAIATRTVVVKDTLPPAIILVGANPLTHPLNVPFVVPGAMALDACGGIIDITTNSTVNIAVPGTYAVTYTATDGYGNSATNTLNVTVINPPTLAGLMQPGAGSFQFSFTSATGVSFTVFATTNLILPLNAWSNLGPVVEAPANSGQYEFTDLQATNHIERFYRVSSP